MKSQNVQVARTSGVYCRRNKKILPAIWSQTVSPSPQKALPLSLRFSNRFWQCTASSQIDGLIIASVAASCFLWQSTDKKAVLFLCYPEVIGLLGCNLLKVDVRTPFVGVFIFRDLGRLLSVSMRFHQCGDYELQVATRRSTAVLTRHTHKGISWVVHPLALYFTVVCNKVHTGIRVVANRDSAQLLVSKRSGTVSPWQLHTQYIMYNIYQWSR